MLAGLCLQAGFCWQGFAGRVLLAGFCRQGFACRVLSVLLAGFCLQARSVAGLQGFACRALLAGGVLLAGLACMFCWQGFCWQGFACGVLPAGLCLQGFVGFAGRVLLAGLGLLQVLLAGFCLQGFACRVLPAGFCWKGFACRALLAKVLLTKFCRVLPAGLCFERGTQTRLCKARPCNTVWKMFPVGRVVVLEPCLLRSNFANGKLCRVRIFALLQSRKGADIRIQTCSPQNHCKTVWKMFFPGQGFCFEIFVC